MIALDPRYRYLEKDLSDYLRIFDGNTDRALAAEILEGEEIAVRVRTEEGCREFRFDAPGFSGYTLLRRKRLVKRFAMAAVYRTLCGLTGRRFPYGAFTGIRPVKQYYQILEEGLDPEQFFVGFMDLEPKKFALVRDIVSAQRGIYSRDPGNLDIYAGIPFCHGRCSYCSFVSCDIDRAGEWEEPYVGALLAELEGGRKILDEADWNIRALYVGGGTPSAISLRNVRRVLEGMRALGAPEGTEFTFEAGRPDSIGRELLDLLAESGVTRISVNPQSANDATLAEIGRRHTFGEVVSKFRLAREYPFDINMDLIMGLGSERAEDFARSVDAVLALEPDCVTVHALALKHGSRLRECESRHESPDSEAMSALAEEKLRAAGYLPYYLYRQKYSVGNLENAGYAKPGKVCVYNVDNMEETASVLAFGANAISKRVYSDAERIDRLASPKDIPSYIGKIPKIIADKSAFRGGNREIQP